jgi:hypothetical protein
MGEHGRIATNNTRKVCGARCVWHVGGIDTLTSERRIVDEYLSGSHDGGLEQGCDRLLFDPVPDPGLVGIPVGGRVVGRGGGNTNVGKVSTIGVSGLSGLSG